MTNHYRNDWLHAGACFAGRLTAALVSAAAMATAQVSIGPDVKVQFMTEAYDVSVAVLDDGSFALAGTTVVADSSPAGGHAQFEVQRYTADGSPYGTAYVPSPLGDDGSVGSLGDHYFVSWRQTPRNKSFATLLSSDGKMEDETFRWINSQAEYYALDYRYSGAPGHAFLPVTYTAVGSDEFGNPIYIPRIQAFGSNGQPLGHPAALFGKPGTISIDDTAMAGDGRYVVVEDLCYDQEGPLRNCGSGFQIFRSSGRPETDFLTESVPTSIAPDGTLNGQISVAINLDGLLMLWVNGISTPHTKLLLALSPPCRRLPCSVGSDRAGPICFRSTREVAVSSRGLASTRCSARI